MRNFALFALVALAGCTGTTTLTATADTTPSSRANLVINAQDSPDSWIALRVADRTGSAMVDTTITVHAGSVQSVALPLAAGSWRLDAVAYRDAALSSTRGEVQLPFELGVDSSVLAKLTLVGDASLSASADQAPRVTGVDVVVDPSGRAVLSASLADADADRLNVYWGSAAASEVVVPGTALTLEPALAAKFSPSSYLIVQDPAGATASARVVFAPSQDCAVCGTPSVLIESLPHVDDPCSVNQTRCVASCDGTSPRCLDDCAIGLTLCRTNP